MNAKDIVRENRKKAIRSMAMRKVGRPAGEPTDEEIAEAASLYNSCIRWAHRKVDFVESETEHNYNSPWRLHEEELIEAAFDRINERLLQYRLRMYIPHLWARLCDSGHPTLVVETDVQLYYFD